MTINTTIPEAAGSVFTIRHGYQVLVRPGLANETEPVVQLAEGEWDPETNDMDDYASVCILDPMDARRIGNALLNAANDAEQGA